MKEILFRGKSKSINKGEWIYGSFVEDADLNACCIRDKSLVYELVDRETVGQYIGLKDKNGNKIFEGDIVSYEDCPASDYYRETIIINRGVIEFLDGAFYVTERETVDMDDLIYNGTMNCEVIGNIHDNPELLERTK